MAEENNTYDEFAVSIFTDFDLEQSSKIGYLPKDYNKPFHEFLKHGGIYSSFINQINEGSNFKNWDYIFISISLSIKNQEQFNLLLKNYGIPCDDLSIEPWLGRKRSYKSII